jgi:tRNA pseudouridine(55) synthase
MYPPSTLITKKLGETPLEALERFRAEKIATASDQISKEEWRTVPMTYAGRLDPMAEGELLILMGEECKQKEKYLGLDKEYEIEVVFGIETDTYDALGLARLSPVVPIPTPQPSVESNNIDPQKYLGKFTQPYPPYSSKTVDGVQLHTLARADLLPEEMPTKEVEIYKIETLSEATITSQELKTRITDAIARVTGDFRQKEIMALWNELFEAALELSPTSTSGTASTPITSNTPIEFKVLTLRIHCSSGTYMRSLAQRIGQDAGTGAFALSIKRTQIFLK